MVEMSLRSCQKGMNKNNMSKNQKVKFNQHKFFQIFLKTLFQHIFAISDALFDPIQHKRYYQHGVTEQKKSKTLSVSLGKCQQEGASFFYCLECKAGIYSCIFTTTTLEVIAT